MVAKGKLGLIAYPLEENVTGDFFRESGRLGRGQLRCLEDVDVGVLLGRSYGKARQRSRCNRCEELHLKWWSADSGNEGRP